MKQGPY